MEEVRNNLVEDPAWEEFEKIYYRTLQGGVAIFIKGLCTTNILITQRNFCHKKAHCVAPGCT
jgi:hypothetical protein